MDPSESSDLVGQKILPQEASITLSSTSKVNMRFLILSVVAVLAALANVSNAEVIGERDDCPISPGK